MRRASGWGGVLVLCVFEAVTSCEFCLLDRLPRCMLRHIMRHMITAWHGTYDNCMVR